MPKAGCISGRSSSLSAIVACLLCLASIGSASAQSISDGVSLGGIGAGSIRLMPDGSVTGSTTQNNWNHPGGRLRASFAAVSIHTANATAARVLATHNDYGLPGCAGLEFEPLFPQAVYKATDPAFAKAGVDVTLRCFSPFIPGDVRNSSVPAAAYVFHLVNRSPVAVSAAVALSWESSIGVGQTVSSESYSDRSGAVAETIPDSDGYFGVHFTEGKRRDTDSNYSGAGGDMALMAHPFRGSAVVTTAGWNALDAKPAWWSSFEGSGVVSGQAAIGNEQSVHPSGVVCVQMTLKPRETVDIPLCVSWYSPVLKGPTGTDYGHYYQIVYRDAIATARGVLDNWQSLVALTEEWQKKILYSSLPQELKHRVVNSVAPLVTNSLYTRDGRFTLLPDVGAAQPQGGSAPAESYLEVRTHAVEVLLTLFPQLYAQEMIQMAALQAEDGTLPWQIADWSARLGYVKSVEEPEDDGQPIDLPHPAGPTGPVVPDPGPVIATRDAAEFVLQSYRIIQYTDNTVFLQHIMPAVRKSMEPLLAGRISRAQADGDVGGGRKSTALLLQEALSAAVRLAAIAEQHAFEWATPSSALGNAPGGLVEIAKDRRFAGRCRETAKSWNLNTSGSDIDSGSAQAQPTVSLAPPSELLTGLRNFSDWGLIQKLEGFHLDLQNEVVSITMPIPGALRSLTAPIFAPTFVGRTEYKPTAHGGFTSLRLDRTITLNPSRSFRRRVGASGRPQLVLKQLRVAGPPPVLNAGGQIVNSASPIEVHVSRGANPIGCTVTREPGGSLLLRFATPVTLLTGDLLLVDVH